MHSTAFSFPLSLRTARLIYAALLTGVVLWLMMIVAAPYLLTHGQPLSGLLVYRCYASLCHQLPERSFHLFHSPLAVCSRCTGLYVGALIGLLMYPLFRQINKATLPHRRWLLLALLPTAIDLGGNALGVFTNTFASRTLTGMLAGAVAACYVFPGVVATFAQFFSRQYLQTSPEIKPEETGDSLWLKLTRNSLH